MAKAVKDQTRIGIVDAHNLFRKGIIQLMLLAERRHNYIITFEASNGKEMIEKMKERVIPDIILIDINMPGMDGFESAKWLKHYHPAIRILALSGDTMEESIVRMLKSGAHGYLSKNIDVEELHKAIMGLKEKGYYLTEDLSGLLLSSFSSPGSFELEQSLNNREKDFLRLACTDLSYSDIANRMFVSPKTVDGYRQQLFEKFNVRSRVGLAMYAVKHGLVKA